MSSDIKRFQSILSHLITSSQKFTDTEFSPDPHTALGGSYTKYNLRRATEVLDNVVIFPKNVDPNDIKLGVLKNAWLLSAFSALSENQENIQRLFLTDEANNAGLYAVWLNENGTWKPVLLDDYIPSRSYHGTNFPVFSQAKQGELWVALLEKAFAKIYGSYANLENGICRHALRDLTGAPVEQLVDAEPEALWEFLQHNIQSQFIVTCSTDLGEEDEDDANEGYVTGHAYTVLDAVDVDTANGEVKLIKIRNPWSNFEWKGDWSDKSDLWTEDLRERLNYRAGAEDGIFFMNLTDYHKYFPVTWACKVRKDNHYQSINITHTTQNHNVIRVVVPEDSEVTISLNQKDKRAFRSSRPDYIYSYARVLVGRVEKEGLEYVTGNASGSERNLETTSVLTAGTYLITTEVNWQKDYHRSFNLSFYSDKELKVENVQYPDLLSIQKNLIKSAVVQQSQSENQKGTYTNYGKYGDANIHKTVDCIHGIFFFFYENNSKKKHKLNETIKFSQISNLKICPPFHTDNQFEVTVLPGSELIVLYKATLEEYSWVYSASFFLQTANKDDEKTPATNYNYIDNGKNGAALEVNVDYNVFIKNSQSSLSKLREQEQQQEQIQKEENQESQFYEDEPQGEKGYYYGKEAEKKSARVEKPPKHYPAIRMERGQTNSKKIPYTNLDKQEKTVKVKSSNGKVVIVKNPEFSINAGETADIRLRFCAPADVGSHIVTLDITNTKNGQVEETLSFTVNVLE